MRTYWWILGGGVVLASLLKASPPQEIKDMREDIAARVVAYVAHGESAGKFWAQNRNTDGQGLSFGLLQWSQRSGSLGQLVRGMFEADPDEFDAVFNVDSQAMIAHLTSQDEADRMLLPLWQEPWTARFRRAGQVATFQEVQARMALTGASWKGALGIADLFGAHTERALVLFYDRANHHGAAGARKYAERLYDELTAQGDVEIDVPELLAAYARACAAPHRRSTAPAERTTSSGKTWRQVGDEWHLFAGNADLYAIIVRRTGEILNDPALRDTEIAREALT